MATLDGKKIAVIGAGFGGLSVSCFLAQAGARVTVFEKNDQLGGRASRLEEDGFTFDLGPSWYLMPDVFERFFAFFGKHPEDLLTLNRLDPHYRIFWKDGSMVDVPPEPSGASELFDEMETGAGAQFMRYLSKSAENYEVAMREFVYKDRASLRDFVSPDLMRHARALTLFGSMERHVRKYFRDPKLQQIMQYTLVFLGGSPKNTPALYNLMSHVDFNLGVYYPDGGVASVVGAVAELADELGVEFRLDSEVTRIEPSGSGLRVHVGDSAFDTDAVVSNADYRHTEMELLPEHVRQFDDGYWSSRTYAPSAFLIYLGVEGEVEELAHHTLVLPKDWDPHFESIFDRPAWPDDPAYYICVPSKTEATVAPPGHSNLFVLVPIAAGLEDTPDLRATYRDKVLADIALHTGTDVRDRIRFERIMCVADFERRYHSSEGTALGLAHTLRQTAFLRPPHRSRKLPGMYFVGAFTTPGIGMPMCLISGEVTSRMIEEDLGA